MPLPAGRRDWFCGSGRFWVSFAERLKSGSVELPAGGSFVVFVRLVSEFVLVPEILKEVELVSSVVLIVDVVFVSTVVSDSNVAFLFFMNNRMRSPFWRRSSAPFSICMLLPLGVEMVAKPPGPAAMAMPRLPGENEIGCAAAG